MMDAFFWGASVFTAFSILIPFYRSYKGPSVFDRVLSIAAIGGKTIALICLTGLYFDRLSMFLDIALTYAILNFIMAIVLAKYMERLSEEETK
ncbi:MAG: monovalent cation/H+ antiporter complex subunit F [Bacteriovoracaceae bacterium]